MKQRSALDVPWENRMLRQWLSRLGSDKTPAAVTAGIAGADGVQSLLDCGNRQLAAGALAQAEACFRRAVEQQHDCTAAHLALAAVLLASGRAEDALDSCQLAVHFSPALAIARVALGNTLLQLGRATEAAAACREALQLDPSCVDAWLCLGNALKLEGDLGGAAGAYRGARTIAPDNLAALQQLAFVEFRRGRYDDARREFDHLLVAAPESANAHHNLALLQLETGYAAEALAGFRRALELQPDTPESMTGIGHALRDLGRLDEAIAAYDAVLARRPDFGDAINNRALTLLARGDYAAGWPAYERRFDATATRARSAGLPRWRGESLNGKTIAVWSEQGLGDEIMFASCLPDLLKAAAHVVVFCEARLRALLACAFPQATVLPRDSALDAGGPQPDFEISIGSLPLYLRPTRRDFPDAPGYLRADPAMVARWRVQFGTDDTMRLGVAWRGGTLRNRQYLRSLALAELAASLRPAAATWVSLQAGDTAEELRALPEHGGPVVRQLMTDPGGNIDELAALIAALDLVITVDNTVAHLAGALGKPVWILLPFSAEWRYGCDGDSTVWYPSARLFRQAAPREWRPVIERVANQLAAFSA
jgi:tetratricopeptide (TPR) repeat protein